MNIKAIRASIDEYLITASPTDGQIAKLSTFLHTNVSKFIKNKFKLEIYTCSLPNSAERRVGIKIRINDVSNTLIRHYVALPRA